MMGKCLMQNPHIPAPILPLPWLNDKRPTDVERCMYVSPVGGDSYRATMRFSNKTLGAGSQYTQNPVPLKVSSLNMSMACMIRGKGFAQIVLTCHHIIPSYEHIEGRIHRNRFNTPTRRIIASNEAPEIYWCGKTRSLAHKISSTRWWSGTGHAGQILPSSPPRRAATRTRQRARDHQPHQEDTSIVRYISICGLR